MMKIITKFIKLRIRGPLMNLINIAYCSLALWLDEIKIEDHLSPAEAEIGAELGNIE